MQVSSYDPLDYKSLSEIVSMKLKESRPFAFAELDEYGPFEGSGVYAIYYSGDFPAYSKMSAINKGRRAQLPIYVGQSSPSERTGSTIYTHMVLNDFNDEEKRDKKVKDARRRLYDRLRDHMNSIRDASNLCLEHFYCKALILNPVWCRLAETALIGEYSPIWNTIVPGFGNHTEGKGREGGQISRWDTLHPGRRRAAKLVNSSTYNDLCAEVNNAIEERISRYRGLDRMRERLSVVPQSEYGNRPPDAQANPCSGRMSYRNRKDWRM